MKILSEKQVRDIERIEASPVERRFIRRLDVQKKTGLSRSTLYRLAASGGDFPAPVKMGPRTVAWIESEVDAYCERVAAARGGAGGEAS